MPRSERPRYASTPLDRTFVPARSIAVLGPITGVTVDAVRGVLTAARSASPTPRIALDPRADQRIWTYRDDIAGGVAVTARPDLPTDDLGELMNRIRERDGARLPVEVVLCGDYVAVDYSHGVGDGQFGTLLVGVVAGDPDGTLAPTLAPALPTDATRRALWRHFRENPRAARDLLRVRAEHARPDTADEGLPTRTVDNWVKTKTCRAEFMPPEVSAALEAWAREHAPGATAASVTVALVNAALRAEQVALDDHVMILFNCRRYLAERDRAGHGNFAIGIPVRLGAGATPGLVATVMKDVIDSGWPLAVLGASEAKSALTRHRIAPVADDTGPVTVPNRLRLAVSDLGNLTGLYRHLDFEHDDRPVQMTATLEPDGPDGITVLVSRLNKGRTLAATFCADMIDPDVVTRALRRACLDPVALLRHGE
ncbi:hypothetical protein [Rhodococcoides corynebacterioides]|uniref:hypothetical protein n=1 Tax=Rhodococcoides corynebacterioides TaxID=53972 RepID=UPI00082DFA77|nr:hypothetical protein [Rhodococcus corynebacterioides]